MNRSPIIQGMKRRSRGAISPLAVTLAVILAVAVVGVAGSVFLRSFVKQAYSNRQADKQSMKTLLDESEKLAEDGKLSDEARFPNTPSGRAAEIAYRLMLDEQRRGKRFEEELRKIGWQEVMTPVLLRDKAGLEASLARVAKAEALVDDMEVAIKASFARFYRDASVLESKNSQAKKVLAGIKTGLEAPNGSRQRATQSLKLVRDNLGSVREACRFLLGKSGKYEVSEDGTIVFDGVPDLEVETYNAIVDRMNASLDALYKLEDERKALLEKARQRLD
jgi:hypothetical protein